MKLLKRVLKRVLPPHVIRLLRKPPVPPSDATYVERGLEFARSWTNLNSAYSDTPETNPLREYFESHHTGLCVWKWRHYFDPYHHHLAKFIGKNVNVLEIGVYGGGSLEMWRHYFGPQCQVYGVDIDPHCKQYECVGVNVLIGDQADRDFWRELKQDVPAFDVIIDDGGHEPEQQIVTLEETLPHLRPGGVYICEDIHGEYHKMNSYIAGLAAHFNIQWGALNSERCLTNAPSLFQRAIEAIHLYPFLVIIERRAALLDRLEAPKHGSSVPA